AKERTVAAEGAAVLQSQFEFGHGQGAAARAGAARGDVLAAADESARISHGAVEGAVLPGAAHEHGAAHQAEEGQAGPAEVDPGLHGGGGPTSFEGTIEVEALQFCGSGPGVAEDGAVGLIKLQITAAHGQQDGQLAGAPIVRCFSVEHHEAEVTGKLEGIGAEATAQDYARRPEIKAARLWIEAGGRVDRGAGGQPGREAGDLGARGVIEVEIAAAYAQATGRRPAEPKRRGQAKVPVEIRVRLGWAGGANARGRTEGDIVLEIRFQEIEGGARHDAACLAGIRHPENADLWL